MKRYLIYIVLFLFIIVGILTIIFFNGTGDAGDSITHYLFSRYAPDHPELFFHHWAKPLFVLLSSPFAQFGFNGMKIFNLISTVLTIFFTYKTVSALKIKNAILVAIIMIFSSQYYVLTFSALTEPLFALFLIVGCYYAVREKYYTSGIIISFIPFVRSEGLIILGVFIFYFLLKKKWKPVLTLGAGHVIYSIAGYFAHHDLLWVFSKIPYTSVESKYGAGDLFHFVRKLLYIIGIPVYILLGSGIISMIYRWIRKKSKFFSAESILIFGGFFAFLVAHSIFWYYGLFDSMGLHRVLIGIVPLIAILALYGYNLITEYFLIKNNWYKYTLQTIVLLYLVIFPFTTNNAAIDWKKDLSLSKDQVIILEINSYLKKNGIRADRYLYNHPYASLVMDIDCFNDSVYSFLNNVSLSSLKEGDLIIWDNWFSIVEGGIDENYIENQTYTEKINSFEDTSHNRESRFTIYRYKKSYDN